MAYNKLPAVSYYTPVELVGIYRSFLERGRSNGVVWLRGIYLQRPNQNPQWAAFYDDLRDVNSNVTVTLKINRQDRQRLKPNSLIQVGGIVELNPFANGTIQIVVSVTRFEIVKDQFVTEQDLKRSAIRIAKSKKGFKNVDAILEDKLFRDERPKVALVFASTSITMADFNAGVNAAAVKIDFTEQRQSFGNATMLAAFLRQQDSAKYDVIALIRGGGSGIEALDEVEVLQAVSEMNTPVICAIGHVGEELFMKSIADKVAPTPNGLGQYFSEMVERVTAKRNNSRAALVEEVRKQFLKQIDESNKKNKELLEQIGKLNKQAEEQRKANTENLKKIQEENAKAQKKQQEENKKNLEAQQKKNDENLAKIQKQSKEQTETLNKSIQKMQETNSNLQKSLDKLTAQNVQATKDLNEAKDRSRELERQLEEALRKNKGCSPGCLGMMTAIVGFASLACWIICLFV
jgi:flagellar biosynthesis GTPase FlhF